MNVVMSVNESMPTWKLGALSRSCVGSFWSCVVACVSALLISALLACPFSHLGVNHVCRVGFVCNILRHVKRCAWFLMM